MTHHSFHGEMIFLKRGYLFSFGVEVLGVKGEYGEMERRVGLGCMMRHSQKIS